MPRGWLPLCADLPNQLATIERIQSGPDRLSALKELSAFDHDYASTIRLDRAIRRLSGGLSAQDFGSFRRIKLAILSTSTTSHLLAGIRVACLNRGLLVDVFEPEYGQIWQQVIDPNSALRAFAPDVVLFANDA
jgi:hypothetical protein